MAIRKNLMIMSEKKAKSKSSQIVERRKGDRRQIHIDPTDLPFPDRRKGEDRRVVSTEEKEEILKRIKVKDEQR